MEVRWRYWAWLEGGGYIDGVCCTFSFLEMVVDFWIYSSSCPCCFVFCRFLASLVVSSLS
jgi:hypothetical protein